MYYYISLKQKDGSHHHKPSLKTTLRRLLCVSCHPCAFTPRLEFKINKSAKVIPLVVREFGKPPRILCGPWQSSSTKPGFEDVSICAAHLLQR